MNSILKFVGIAMLLGSLSGPAFAQDSEASETVKSTFPEPRKAEADELKTHVGLQLGYADPGSGYDAGAQYGIEVGFQPYIPFGLAVEFTTFDSVGDAANDDLTRTKLMAKGTYNFGGPTIFRNTFVGTGLGPVFDDVNGTTVTRLGINLLAGFDIPLSEQRFSANTFSLGATANYLIVTEDSPDNFLLSAQLKYWF